MTLHLFPLTCVLCLPFSLYLLLLFLRVLPTTTRRVDLAYQFQQLEGDVVLVAISNTHLN